MVEGKRKTEDSIEELISRPILERLGGDETGVSIKFLSAGREDVDVMCLGTGRPFALEILVVGDELSDAEGVCWEEVTKVINERAKGQIEIEKLVEIEQKDLNILVSNFNLFPRL